MANRKRKSGMMSLDLEGPVDQAESGMVIKQDHIQKVLVVDPDGERCARIAGAMPPEHIVFVAHETTRALALIVVESPAVVVAQVDLGSMPLSRFMSLVDYAAGSSPRYVAVGSGSRPDPRVVTVGSDRDLAELSRRVAEILGPQRA